MITTATTADASAIANMICCAGIAIPLAITDLSMPRAMRLIGPGKLLKSLVCDLRRCDVTTSRSIPPSIIRKRLLIDVAPLVRRRQAPIEISAITNTEAKMTTSISRRMTVGFINRSSVLVGTGRVKD